MRNGQVYVTIDKKVSRYLANRTIIVVFTVIINQKDKV